MVEFNTEEDGRFNSSLEDLGPDGELEVLTALYEITTSQLAWADFKEMYGWAPVVWEGDNTYPGANELYTFVVGDQGGELYEIAGSCIDETVVVCAVAKRKVELRPRYKRWRK